MILSSYINILPKVGSNDCILEFKILSAKHSPSPRNLSASKKLKLTDTLLPWYKLSLVEKDSLSQDIILNRGILQSYQMLLTHIVKYGEIWPEDSDIISEIQKEIKQNLNLVDCIIESISTYNNTVNEMTVALTQIQSMVKLTRDIFMDKLGTVSQKLLTYTDNSRIISAIRQLEIGIKHDKTFITKTTNPIVTAFAKKPIIGSTPTIPVEKDIVVKEVKVELPDGTIKVVSLNYEINSVRASFNDALKLAINMSSF